MLFKCNIWQDFTFKHTHNIYAMQSEKPEWKPEKPVMGGGMIPCHGHNCIPIDNGLIFLIIVVVIYTAIKLRKMKHIRKIITTLYEPGRKTKHN